MKLIDASNLRFCIKQLVVNIRITRPIVWMIILTIGGYFWTNAAPLEHRVSRLHDHIITSYACHNYLPNVLKFHTILS